MKTIWFNRKLQLSLLIFAMALVSFTVLVNLNPRSSNLETLNPDNDTQNDNELQNDASPFSQLQDLDFDTVKNFGIGDIRLLKYINDHHVYEPSDLPYNLSHPEKNPSEFSAVLDSIFLGKRNKVFIECGANDGEFLSNTLWLEREQGWSGLLIEANPLMIPKLLSKRRKATVLDVCLSSSPLPEKLQFLDSKGNLQWEKGAGKVQPDSRQHPKFFDQNNYNPVGFVECFPLYSILAARNIQQVDYFSLDIEGNEMKILKQIPYDMLDIKVIQVEHWLAPEGKVKIQKFMESRGYKLYKETKSDFIFKKL